MLCSNALFFSFLSDVNKHLLFFYFDIKEDWLISDGYVGSDFFLLSSPVGKARAVDQRAMSIGH